MKEYVCVGLMSGTSLDGLDIVICKFKEEKLQHYDLIFGQVIPFSESLFQKISRATTMNGLELALLDIEFGT